MILGTGSTTTLGKTVKTAASTVLGGGGLGMSNSGAMGSGGSAGYGPGGAGSYQGGGNTVAQASFGTSYGSMGPAPAPIGAPAPITPAAKPAQSYSTAPGAPEAPGRDVAYTGGSANALQSQGAGGGIAGTTYDVMNRAASQRLAAVRR